MKIEKYPEFETLRVEVDIQNLVFSKMDHKQLLILQGTRKQYFCLKMHAPEDIQNTHLKIPLYLTGTFQN